MAEKINKKAIGNIFPDGLESDPYKGCIRLVVGEFFLHTRGEEETAGCESHKAAIVLFFIGDKKIEKK